MPDRMFFEIEHSLTYTYSAPVFLEPFVVRLTPRCDAAQQLLAHDLEVDPRPIGRAATIDTAGHTAVTLWFEGQTDRLLIEARSRVETRRANPFDFILTAPEALALPVAYPPPLAEALASYRRRSRPADAVQAWAQEAARQVDGETLRFLPHLAEHIGKDFLQVVRPEGPPLGPEETLRRRTGACRDLAVLFLDACRCLGLAARFVSGYKAQPDEDGSPRQLHAWAEVFLPGGGWRGYDPSVGVAVAAEHVALAAESDPALAAPSSGSFRGTGVGSQLEFEIEIRARQREELSP